MGPQGPQGPTGPMPSAPVRWSYGGVANTLQLSHTGSSATLDSRQNGTHVLRTAGRFTTTSTAAGGRAVDAFSNGVGGTACRGHAANANGVGLHGVSATTSSTSSSTGAGVLGEARTRYHPGVLGTNSAGAGVGVYGRATGASSYGLYGIGQAYGCFARGTNGSGAWFIAGSQNHGARGVQGSASTTKGSASNIVYGVYGHTGASAHSRAVYGWTTGGSAAAVYGERPTTNFGYGVYGKVGGGFAVYGETRSGTGGYFSASEGVGVQGFGSTTVGTGVRAVAGFIGVDGRATATNRVTYAGIFRQAANSSSYGVYCSGRLHATSTKSFLNPHPSDPSKNIQFYCLEGNENGTYFRGSSRTVGRRAELSIPKEWIEASEAHSITVQLTAIGSAARVYVESKSRERIVIASTSDCAFDYQVNGIRRGYSEYEAYVAATPGFIPEVRGVPFGLQYPKALRDVLVKNGTLNADYTPNEATARKMGWKLKDPEDVRLEERYWLTDEERKVLAQREQAKVK